METRLVEKLDLMAMRCTSKNFDNLIVFDGDEGYGKTTLSIEVGYYMAWKTGRKFDVNNIFFDIEEMIKYATETKEQIILWDEAALGGLSDQFRNKIQTRLIQLLMVARKKKHIWLFNIPKFFKLREYIILDRAICLIHVYARKEIELGRFVYFNKKNKEKLYYFFKQKKQRNYKKFYNFRGTFPDVLADLIDENIYDKKKDEAILSIGQETDNSGQETEVRKLKYIIANFSDVKQKDLAEKFGVSVRTIQAWKVLNKKHPEIEDFSEGDGTKNDLQGGKWT